MNHERYVQENHVDVNGHRPVQCQCDHEPSPHRRLHGDGVDAVRAGRSRTCSDAHRPHRSGRRCVAAVGVGRNPVAAHRATEAGGVHAVEFSDGGAARRRDGGRHDVVHGRGSQDSARHGQRTGVPRTPRRRGGTRHGQASPGVAGPGSDRCRAADTTMGRCRRPHRCAVRDRGRRVLGRLHPADPAGG